MRLSILSKRLHILCCQAKQELFETIKAFHACKQEEGQSVSAYILKMKVYLDTLERRGYVIPKELGVSLLLNSLNKDYDQFVQNYNMHNIGKSIVELHVMLKLHEKGALQVSLVIHSLDSFHSLHLQVNEARGAKDTLGILFWGEPESLEVAPASPDYVPGPEELEQAPLSPDYVPGPEYPEYLASSDEEVPVEDQPYAVADSPIALSPGYVADSDPEEDFEDGPVDYPADGGDGNDDDSSDDDEEEEEASEEEKDEHLAPANSVVAPVVDHVPFSEETKLFETDESAATPPSPPVCQEEVERLLAVSPPPPSPLISLSSPSAEERLTRCLVEPALPSSPLPIVPHPYGSPNYMRVPPSFRATMGRLRASSPSTTSITTITTSTIITTFTTTCTHIITITIITTTTTTSLTVHTTTSRPSETVGMPFLQPHENKVSVARHAELFKNSLKFQEASGSIVGLELLQEEDI
ncbi:hypothetical protein Tco_0805832 [Tanacetum coccineum]